MAESFLTFEEFINQVAVPFSQIYGSYAVMAAGEHAPQLGQIEQAIAALESCFYHRSFESNAKFFNTARDNLSIILKSIFALKETSQTLNIIDNVTRIAILLDKLVLVGGVRRQRLDLAV